MGNKACCVTLATQRLGGRTPEIGRHIGLWAGTCSAFKQAHLLRFSSLDRFYHCRRRQQLLALQSLHLLVHAHQLRAAQLPCSTHQQLLSAAQHHGPYLQPQLPAGAALQGPRCVTCVTCSLWTASASASHCSPSGSMHRLQPALQAQISPNSQCSSLTASPGMQAPPVAAGSSQSFSWGGASSAATSFALSPGLAASSAAASQPAAAFQVQQPCSACCDKNQTQAVCLHVRAVLGLWLQCKLQQAADVDSQLYSPPVTVAGLMEMLNVPHV